MDLPKFLEWEPRDRRVWCDQNDLARDLVAYMELFRTNILNSIATAAHAGKHHEATLAAGALDCITSLLAITKYAQDPEPAKDADTDDDFVDSALIP